MLQCCPHNSEQFFCHFLWFLQELSCFATHICEPNSVPFVMPQTKKASQTAFFSIFIRIKPQRDLSFWCVIFRISALLFLFSVLGKRFLCVVSLFWSRNVCRTWGERDSHCPGDLCRRQCRQGSLSVDWMMAPLEPYNGRQKVEAVSNNIIPPSDYGNSFLSCTNFESIYSSHCSEWKKLN